MVDHAGETNAPVAPIRVRLGATVAKFVHHPILPFAVIFSCLAAGLVLKIVFINVPHGSDDLRYFRFAEELVFKFNLDTLDHAASRLVFLVLSGFPAVLIGNMYFGALANIFYCFLTEALVIRFIYVRLGISAAAVSTVFLTFSGTSLVFSGTLTPEPILTLFFTYCSLSIFRSITSTRPEQWTSAGLAGLAAGLAYSAKDTGILLLPPSVLCLLFVPWPLKNFKDRISAAAIFLGGFAAIWVLESAAYWVIADDFLYKIHAISGVHNANVPESKSILVFLKKGYWNLYTVWKSFDFLFVPTALAAVTWTAMLRTRTPWPAFALIGFFTAGFMFFGTSSLSRLVNLPFQERYAYVLFPLIGIGVGFMFCKIQNAMVRALLLCAIAIHGISSLHGATHRAGNLYFEPVLRNGVIALHLLSQREQRNIYVDKRYRLGLNHVAPNKILHDLRDIPLKGPLLPGYYMVFPKVSGGPIFRKRYAEIIQLPVALRIALPHSFASRYFSGVDTPRFETIVYEMPE